MFKRLLIGAAALTAAILPSTALADVDGYDRMVRVENRSNSEYIVAVVFMNEHGRIYDAMWNTYIDPGYNRVLTFDDNEQHGHCDFIIEATFSNGVTARRAADVCSISVWRIYDLDNTVE